MCALREPVGDIMHDIIIIYYEVFLYFFPNQFFQKYVIFLGSGGRK